jgi:hypothetical protein
MNARKRRPRPPAPKSRAAPIPEADRRAVYDVLTASGPDVDMWSPRFGRLVGQIRKDGCLDAGHEVIYAWLSEHGYFGPKSDTLRAPGDRYY